jgi:hypothetical protein
MNNAVANQNSIKLLVLQSVAFSMLEKQDISLTQIDNINVPSQKRFLDYHLNQLLYKYYKSEKTLEDLQNMRVSLQRLQPVDNDNKELNTSLILVDYFIYKIQPLRSKQTKKYIFDELRKYKSADKKIAAQIAIDLAVDNDIRLRLNKVNLANKRYLYNDIKRFISKAKFTADQILELASFYTS